MARKNDDRKAVARGHKAGGGKPHAGRPAVAKRAAPAGKPKAAPAPKGVGQPGAKGVAAPPPPAPTGKFRGRGLEHAPLAPPTADRIAGAARAELAEVLTECTVMDAAGKIRQVPRKQIPFKYRSSNLGAVIVLEAKLALIEEPPAKLKELQGRLLRWRKAGTPFDLACCGSVFKNPGGPRTAGVLIDESGLKRFTIGGAQVSPLHANYIVNTGTATASDVLRVIDHVRKTVAKKTGVELELEVKVVGS